MGSSKFPWQVEDGLISAELSLTMNEYTDWVFELFLGQSLTVNAAEASGDVSALTNKYGSSVLDAALGIASVTATSADESDLKFGKYVVKAVSADTFDVYCSSDIDFAGEVYDNDLLKINSAPFDISSVDAVSAEYGLTFAKGSGTVAMTIGDTAVFKVRPINTGSVEGSFGSSSSVYPEFGAIVMAQMQGSGKMFELDILKLKNIGAPISMSANEFSEFEITAKASYDSSSDAVFTMVEVDS